MVRNNSKNRDYFTQRNNMINPKGACSVTAMVAALSAAGWPVHRLASPTYPQPEDALMHFLFSDSAVDGYWKKVDPTGKYPPNEWHTVLSFGTNAFLRKKGLLQGGCVAVEFRMDARLEDIIARMDGGGAAVLSGVFPSNGRTLGHVVACVGYEKNEKGNVCAVIIDDSWGDYRTEYRNHNGNDIPMSIEDFRNRIRHLEKPDMKMAHLVSRYAGAC